MRDEVVGSLQETDVAGLWRDSSQPVLAKWRALEKVGGSCGACGLQAQCGYGCRANAFYSGGTATPAFDTASGLASAQTAAIGFDAGDLRGALWVEVPASH